MATPGYDGQVVGRDCDCEDFPCCGHGITQADIDEGYFFPEEADDYEEDQYEEDDEDAERRMHWE